MPPVDGQHLAVLGSAVHGLIYFDVRTGAVLAGLRNVHPRSRLTLPFLDSNRTLQHVEVRVYCDTLHVPRQYSCRLISSATRPMRTTLAAVRASMHL